MHKSLSEIDELLNHLQAMVSGGYSVQQACNALVSLGQSRGVVDEARARFEARMGLIREFREPPVVDGDPAAPAWYAGPPPVSPFWDEFMRNAQATLPSEVSDAALVDIDRSSSRILDLCGAPGWDEIRTKGLVLGYVQSGKTTNFMAVISKAADVGYRLFVVLSGLTDNLRYQTQQRVESILVGANPQAWHLLTDLETDFAVSANAANLLSKPALRMIAVVKKNPARLRRLAAWLESAGEEVLKTLPILLIDDEADQASLDVGSGKRVTRINQLIGRIIDQPRSAYVAYTATPFANLLSDPDRYGALYPSDFIVTMPQPKGYYGPERLFGRDSLSLDESEALPLGIDVIRSVGEEEAALMTPRGRGGLAGWDPSVGEGLGEALDWFVLATAARRVRGQTGHSTMLIHTSMLARAHNRLRGPVDARLSAMRAQFGRDGRLAARLQQMWTTESRRVDAANFGLEPLSWGEISRAVPDTLASTRTIVDNYTSQERLDYDPDTPATVVVIGGNTLSRGLTLEGLVSSYFVRSASYYDTLLQMGRWFGFRRQYEDLPRIWTTDELAGWFRHVATIEEEIRREIRAFPPGMTPANVGVRIRTHPAIAVTSRAKMYNAVDAAVDYRGRREQTILFNHRDASWLGSNLAAGRTLLANVRSAALLQDDADRGRVTAEAVGVDRVLEFLSAYQFHEQSGLRRELLCDYIKQQNAKGLLTSWNVTLVENPGREPAQGLDLGIGRPVRPIGRSRLSRYGAYANIGALVSPMDRLADVDRSAISGLSSDLSDPELVPVRKRILGGDVGLVCLYPVDKDSAPGSNAKDGLREPLEALDHVLGVGIYFPDSTSGTAVPYVTARITERLEFAADDYSAVDEADEAIAAREEESRGTHSG